MNKKVITKADIVLAIILLIIGIGSPFLIAKTPAENAKVIITINGEDVKNLDLNQDETIYFITKDDYAYLTDDYLLITKEEAQFTGMNWEAYVSNEIVVENGKVCVKEATCSGQDCVKTGSISKEGQVIACLPHKLMVTISNPEESGDVDVVIK